MSTLSRGCGHLCEGLQAVVPRLQHLRLRLAVMCCLIFGDGFTAHGTIEDESKFKYITAPMLRTVVINCDNHSAHGSHSHVCDTFSEMPYSMCRGALKSRIALGTCLRLLVSRGALPMCHKLWLIDMQFHDNEDRTVFAAYNQRDVLNNVTRSSYSVTMILTRAAHIWFDYPAAWSFWVLLWQLPSSLKVASGWQAMDQDSDRSYGNEKSRQLRTLSLPAAPRRSLCLPKQVKSADPSMGMGRSTGSDFIEGNPSRGAY